MIVADANVIFYLVRSTTLTHVARAVYAADSEWILPGLWKSEVLNALSTEIRAGLLHLKDARLAIHNAIDILDDGIRDVDADQVLQIAHDTGLTAYDATYVSLARTQELVLVTEDKKILRSCPDIAQTMHQFLDGKAKSTMLHESRGRYRTKRSKT